MKKMLNITLLLFMAQLNIIKCSKEELINAYKQASEQKSDINEHVPVLYKLATECSIVTELGVRSMVATWGLIYGLTNNNKPIKKYIGVDLSTPSENSLSLAKRLSKENKIEFNFIQNDDLKVDIKTTDLLFIDTLHTYCHLTCELEKFARITKKYIVMHDTSAPWGHQDEPVYNGYYSQYPEWVDKNKRGLWPAVEDFLNRHKEWELLERKINNHGLTILKRINNRSKK